MLSWGRRVYRKGAHQPYLLYLPALRCRPVHQRPSPLLQLYLPHLPASGRDELCRRQRRPSACATWSGEDFISQGLALQLARGPLVERERRPAREVHPGQEQAAHAQDDGRGNAEKVARVCVRTSRGTLSGSTRRVLARRISRSHNVTANPPHRALPTHDRLSARCTSTTCGLRVTATRSGHSGRRRSSGWSPSSSGRATSASRRRSSSPLGTPVLPRGLAAQHRGKGAGRRCG